jgi:hypothetical protein
MGLTIQQIADQAIVMLDKYAHARNEPQVGLVYKYFPL